MKLESWRRIPNSGRPDRNLFSGRKGGKLCVLLAGLLLFSGCTKPESQINPPIRFAFQNRVGSAIPVIAVEKGFFAEEGLVVDPLRFTNGPACSEALYSGSADIGTMGDTAAIISASRNPELEMIASHSTGEHRHRLMVRGGSEYRRLEDLVGRRIGIKKGTSTYGGFLAVATASGLDAAGFEVTDLSPSMLPEALIAGSLDAFAASEPTPSVAEMRGARELMTFGGLGNRYPIMMLAQKSFLASRPKDAKAFMRAMARAERFIRNQPDETASIMALATNLPRHVVKSAMKRHEYRIELSASIVDSLTETAAFLKDSGKIETVPPIAHICNPAFIQHAGL